MRGSGTPDNPYVIASCRELTQLDEQTESDKTYYCLSGNIDGGGHALSTGGQPSSIMVREDVILDGNGYTIKNIDIRESTQYGLFDNHGVIKNLNFENISIGGLDSGIICGKNNNLIHNCSINNCELVESELDSKPDSWGLIAGCNKGVIRDCDCRDSEIVGEGTNAGGITGINWRGGIVKNSIVDVDIENFSCCGGIAGTNHGEIIKSEVVGGKINGNTVSGGLVGENQGELSDSRATPIVEVEQSDSYSEIMGPKSTGGLVGHNEGDLKYSYFYGEINGDSTTHIGTIVGMNHKVVSKCYSLLDEFQVVGYNTSVGKTEAEYVENIEEAKERIVIGKI